MYVAWIRLLLHEDATFALLNTIEDISRDWHEQAERARPHREAFQAEPLAKQASVLAWLMASRPTAISLGKPCGSCRVICSLSHARLRGYSPFFYRDLCRDLIRSRIPFPPSFPSLLPLSSSIPWFLQSSARVALMLKFEHSSCDRGKCSCSVDCLIIY